MSLGEVQSCAPRMLIRFRVHLNWQWLEICERRVAKSCVVPLASHTRLQNVGNIQPPKSRNPCATRAKQLRHASNRFGGFVAVYPRQCDLAVEDEAHGRP